MLALFLTSTFPVARLIGPFNGTLLAVYQYDPYGNLTSSTGSVANPWRFAAGYFDSSTGLYKFGTRYYNPGFGRWSQQDPVKGHLDNPTSLNRYVYAGNDPVNLVDPSGRESIFDAWWACLTSTAGGLLLTVPPIILLFIAAFCALPVAAALCGTFVATIVFLAFYWSLAVVMICLGVAIGWQIKQWASG